MPYVESDVGKLLLTGKGDESQVVGVVVEAEVEVVEAVEVVGVAGVEKVVGVRTLFFRGNMYRGSMLWRSVLRGELVKGLMEVITVVEFAVVVSGERH